jgi:hypothetical protein
VLSSAGLNGEDFQWRHEEVIGEWEEGRITLDEYLDITIFYTERPFSREEFTRFMCEQSVPHPETIRIAQALSHDPRYTVMTLNNEAEELNTYRIEHFGIAETFEAFLSSCWLGVRKPIRRLSAGTRHRTRSQKLALHRRPTAESRPPATGMNVILFRSAAQLRSDLKRFLDLELPGA